MKIIYFAAITVLCGMSLTAQTNAPVAPTVPTAPVAPRALTRIDSDNADFDLNGHKATYRGDVHVDDPEMKLSCEWLVADLPQSGGHMNHIVAETNVVIDFADSKGQINHATSDKAVYDYKVVDGVTNETVTFTGNAKIENVQSTLTGEPIIWDRATGHLTATDQKMIFRQNLNGMMAATNSPATNRPPTPK